MLVAALQQRVAAVDDETRDTQQGGQHEDAQHERLAFLAISQRMQTTHQLSTLAVRFVVRFPENSVTPRMLTLAG